MEKTLLTILTLLVLSHPAMADWSPDGVPLQTIEHGIINGGIYIGGGHGKEYTTNYNQNFTVPSGTVKWARLYVSAKDTLWINVSLNGHLLGNYTDLSANPNVYANYKPDKSMYWAYYDNAAEWLVNGTNTATADFGTRVGLNTKSWGEYWVNEGNPLLHSDHLPFTVHSNTTNTSFANIIDTDEVTNATLWTAYIWGSEEGELQPHDSLWFNSYLTYEDASDGAGTDDQGNIWRGACFDLEKWDVTHSLVRDNIVSFDRGGDNLLCPVGAVLVLQRGSGTTPASQTVHLGASILPAISLEVVPETLNFGALAPGEQSEIQILTLTNKCTNTINITADVTDTVAGLYVDGLLLDSDNWNAFSRSVAKGTAVEADAMLDVPDDYARVGIQEGMLIFWAETA
jgi:hypothetical protein